MMCQFECPIVDTHATHSHTFFIIENQIQQVKICPLFENLSLKRIYYKLKKYKEMEDKIDANKILKGKFSSGTEF